MTKVLHTQNGALRASELTREQAKAQNLERVYLWRLTKMKIAVVTSAVLVIGGLFHLLRDRRRRRSRLTDVEQVEEVEEVNGGNQETQRDVNRRTEDVSGGGVELKVDVGNENPAEPSSPTIMADVQPTPPERVERPLAARFPWFAPQSWFDCTRSGTHRVVTCPETGRHYQEKSFTYFECDVLARKCEIFVATELARCCAFLNHASALYNEGRCYLLSEFLSGGKLERYVGEGQSRSLEVCRLLAAQVLLGLEALHDKSVMHRDLNLGTIQVSDLGFLLIGDFGYATTTANAARASPPNPLFMAPELVYGGGEGLATDVWAFGVLVYRLLIGQYPFPDFHMDDRGNDQFFVNLVWRISSVLDGRPELCDFFASIFQVKMDDRPTATTLKNHPFFRGVDWEGLTQRTVESPLLGEVHANKIVPAPLGDLKLRSRLILGPVFDLTAGSEEH